MADFPVNPLLDVEQSPVVRSRMRDRYAELDAAAQAEVDPARKVELLDERDALFDASQQFLRPEPTMPEEQLGQAQPIPAPPGGIPQPPPPTSPIEQAGMASMGTDPTEGLPTPGQALPVFLAGAMGSKGNPAEVRRQRGIAATERGKVDTAQAGVVENFGEVEQANIDRGNKIADAIAGGVERVKQDARDQEARARQLEADVAEYERGRNQRQQALEQEMAKQDRSVMSSMSDGELVASAIMVGLGQFAAGMTGGPNAAYKILQDRVNHEVDARASRIQNGRAALDEWDRQFEQALKATGSVDAAKAEARAIRYEALDLVTKSYASRFGGQEAGANAAIMSNKYQEDAAKEKAKAADAAARANAGRRGDPAKALKDAAAYAKAYGEMRKEMGKLDEQELDPTTRRFILMNDTAMPALNQAEQNLMHLKQQGYTEVPGKERPLRSPAIMVGRLAARAVGGIGELGGTGKTKEEEYTTTQLESTFRAAYMARYHNSPNLTTEAEFATREAMGTGDIDSALLNIRMLRSQLEAQGVDALRKDSHAVRNTQIMRHLLTPSATPTPFGAEPPRGATRVGRTGP